MWVDAVQVGGKELDSGGGRINIIGLQPAQQYTPWAVNERHDSEKASKRPPVIIEVARFRDRSQ